MANPKPKPKPFILPALEANEKKALKKFNETGVISPLLIPRFDQRGKFRIQIEMNKRGSDKTLELIKKVRDITLPLEKIASSTTSGGKILHTGFYDEDSLKIETDWETIEGPIHLHLCEKISLPNLITCCGTISASNTKAFLAPNLETSHSIDLTEVQELNLPKLKKIIGDLSTNATAVLLPSLREIDGSISAKDTEVFDASELEKAGSIYLLSTKKINFPNLKTLRGGFTSNAKVFLAPKLTIAANLNINGCDCLDLSSLKTIEDQADFLPSRPDIIYPINLPALEAVHEIVALWADSLTLPSLKKVGLGIRGSSSLKRLLVPDQIPLHKLYISDELLASLKEARIPRLKTACETTLVAEPPRISAFVTTETEGHTADCTFWVKIKETKTAEEAAATFRHAKVEVKKAGGNWQDNWVGVRTLCPIPVLNEPNNWEIPCRIKVFLSGKTIDAARRELDKLYQDITTCWDNGTEKGEYQQICSSGKWSFSIRESKAGELCWDERRQPRDPWGKIWQRQPNLYPWEEIKSSDSLEEAIAKAKIIYRDSVMLLENWEIKNILSTTHPNYCE